MIAFEKVTKTYPGLASPILDQVSLEVSAGEIMVLLGSSGSGKTTLLKLVNRLLDPDSGVVRLDGQDTAGFDLISLRRRCGYVLQEGGLLPHLDVVENIELLPSVMEPVSWFDSRRTKLRAARREHARELLKLVGLSDDLGGRFPRQLSGGQQQRVNVARALALDPPILLMDEPFGALDEITRGQLQEAFREWQSRLHKTVLFVTHDLFEAITLADRIAVLAEGKIEQVGTPADLLQRPATDYVRQLFARPVRQLEQAAQRRAGDAR
jgi:osmoprotectant transport system ATP-binding protein